MKRILSVVFVLCSACSWGALGGADFAEEKLSSGAVMRDSWDRCDEWVEAQHDYSGKRTSKKNTWQSSSEKEGQKHSGQKKKKERRASTSDLPKEGELNKGKREKKRAFSSSAIGSWRK